MPRKPLTAAERLELAAWMAYTLHMLAEAEEVGHVACAFWKHWDGRFYFQIAKPNGELEVIP